MNNNTEHSNLQRVLLKVCAVLCAILINVNPVKANAMNPVLPIPPVWLPLNPYNTESIVPNAEVLSDEQKNILYDIIGAYNHIYLGFGGFVFTNPILGIRQWWNEYGETFYNSFTQSIVGTPRAIIDMVGSATYKASQYETEQEFLNDISDTSTSNYMEYNPELTFAFRDWYFNKGGVEQWQTTVKPFNSSVNWITPTNSASGTLLAEYSSIVSSYPNLVRLNASANWLTGWKVNFSYFNTHTNLFINTSTHKIYLCNDVGEYQTGQIVDNNANNIYVDSGRRINNSNSYDITWYDTSYNPNNYQTYKDIVIALYNFTLVPYYTGQGYIFFEDFVKRVYVGANWLNKQEIFNIDDLNIGNSGSNYIDNVGNTSYTDINGLYTSLGAADIKTGVFDNTLVKTEDGTQVQQLTDALVQAIDKFQTTPNSGIVIPTELFTPVKGFMDYMWYMTKPLIIFTNDVIKTLTFGAVDGFINSGPAIFVFGVIAFGLIGGLIVKCLL